MNPLRDDNLTGSVAIIGMSGRFPGAGNVSEFWQNLCSGKESISQFEPHELEVPDCADLAKPNYVRARSILNGVDMFDAPFFGMYPREAELTDPQHRLFLECCWEALEDAGYDPASSSGAIGVFAGCSPSTYFLANVCASPDFIRQYTAGYQVANYTAMMGANTEFLSTRVSYKLDLKGPSFTMHAGCATSLLAVAQAYQNLISYQCDMALAGGASISFPQKRGYVWDEGGMVSPDGHCRPFDAQAQGTVFGSGVATVLLKRLEDAVADGDHVYAVIRGCGVNNDGSNKVGFTAPSVDGQAAAIAMAHATAGVPPESISYVETHGTATPLGDPIEFAALTKAFRLSSQRKGFCRIGSVKGNVGHLDAAAGITGLIKTALALANRKLPPTLHFKQPNPRIDMENSPFRVVSGLTEWLPGEAPRRAGVSAFGVGGTNVHVILEEAPVEAPTPDESGPQLLVISGRSQSARDTAAANIGEHFRHNTHASLADAAYTMQTGRRHFEHRGFLVARDTQKAAALGTTGGRLQTQASTPLDNPPIGFLFPGQGAQFAGMGRGLYEAFPEFRRHVDHSAEILHSHIGSDIRDVLYPSPDSSTKMQERIGETILAQPALFVTEYALARLWMAWGIQPAWMLGHSVGEFVAACLAGVFSEEDALSILATRGRLMQQLPPGGMMAVRLPEHEVTELLNGSLSLAASNGPSLCVAAGPLAALDKLEEELKRRGATFRRLPARHAFHSSMMDPIIEPFIASVRRISLNEPCVPYISGVTGTWITRQEATSPTYWAQHFRQTVRFTEGIQVLRRTGPAVFLETGPGHTLTSLAQLRAGEESQAFVNSLPESMVTSEVDHLLNALGRLWLAGARPDWQAVHSPGRKRVSLPTYPFEKKRYWVEPPSAARFAEVDGQRRLDLNMNQPIEKTAATGTARNERLIRVVTEVLQELSGIDEPLNPADTFLEQGFDSLFMAQVVQAIQGKWRVRITFRQILEECASITGLAEYLDRNLAPDAPEPAPQAQTIPAAIAGAQPASAPSLAQVSASSGAAGGAPQGATALERILADQIQAMSQLMARQCELLRQNSADNLTAVPPSPTVTAPVAASREAPNQVTPGDAKAFGPYKPAQKTTAGKLTPQQETHLRALIARYNARTSRSRDLTQARRPVLADPRAAAGFRTQWKEMVYPIVSARSRGSRFWDVDGNEYIDIVNGYGPILFGHMPDFVRTAIAEQLDKGIETGPQSPLAGEVAALVCELTGMDRVTFCSTGSEAVMAALRVARTVTGRAEVVMFAGDYHGAFDEVLAKPVRRGGQLRSAPVAPGILQSKVDYITVLDYGTPESLAYIQSHASELAAVLVEPVQSRNPDLQPVEFLREIRRITEQNGAVLIFDEVVTGFRVHSGGVQALFGIHADLATYGKVVAGGMPIGLVAGRRRFMDTFDGGMWSYGDDSMPEAPVTFFAGTFVRHPLALAAARAVLLELKRQGPALQENLNRRTQALVERLKALFRDLGVPVQLGQFASIFYIALPHDVPFQSLLYYHLREKGIHIQEGFPCFLTTAHSDEDLEQIVNAFRQSVIELQEGNLLPQAPIEPLPQSQSESIEAPVTEAQREIFLAATLCDEASCAYNEAFTLHMRGRLDETALGRSLAELLNRHQALRATISLDGERIIIHPAVSIEIPVVDLSALDQEARLQAFSEIMSRDACTAFDLSNGPLVRAQTIRFDPEHHGLLFTSHHIVCDGWSTNVLLEEIGKIYNAFKAGKAHGLPAPPRFDLYARSMRERASSPQFAEMEAYWLREFTTIPEPLELPYDRPRKREKDYAGSTYRHKIGRETYERVRRAGAKQGCTVFATLLAAFEAFLSRLSNQQEVVIGIPNAAQPQLDYSNLVGHCVNLLPVRGRISPDTLITDLMLATKKKLLDAIDHQGYTYGTLVRKLVLRRDAARPPLVDVQFNVERVGRRLEMDGLTAWADPAPKQRVNFDLFLNILESPDGLTLDFDYNTGLFDEQTIAHWAGHYEHLLGGIAQGSVRHVSELPLLSDAEQRQILLEWNNTARDYPRAASVAQLFETQCQLHPGSTALVMGGDLLSYSELNHRANRLAYVLMARGTKAGDPVAMLLERSSAAIITMLAILKAGGVYTPLDPAWPWERLRTLLEDSGARLVITESRFTSKLPTVSRPLFLDEIGSELDAMPEINPAAPVSGDSPAYIMYTSGSTGKPKGVLVPHRAIVRLVRNTNYASLNGDEVFLQLAPLSFDASTLEIWAPLLNGGRLVVMPEGLSSLEEIAAVIQEQRVTTLWLTAGLFHAIVDERPEALAPLKQLLAGGDVLSPDHVRRFRRAVPECRFINGYGPTEGTTFSCCYTVEEDPHGPIPIGRPIANTAVFILDARNQPVPAGVTGELCVAGDGLALGYVNGDQLTAETFATMDLPLVGATRVYRTGDMARFRRNGEIEFLGRKDSQVKIRGYRVEIGEIETVIRRHTGIRDVAVVPREDRPGNPHLVAYLVADPEQLGTGQLSLSAGRESRSKSQWDAASGLSDDEADLLARRTAERIVEFKPDRVLEIGFGSGRLLRALAPLCRSYVATEVDEAKVHSLSAELAGTSISTGIALERRAPGDFTGIEPGTFDAVILNSNLCYFPSAESLLCFLKGAARCVRPDGLVYICAVPDADLRPLFHSARALGGVTSKANRETLRERTQWHIESDNTLLIAPAFFDLLKNEVPGLAAVETLPLRGPFRSQQTVLFADTHYDVRLHVGAPAAEVSVTGWLDWETDGLTADGLRTRVAALTAGLGVSRAPIPRLLAAAKAHQSMMHGAGSDALPNAEREQQDALSGIDLEQLWNMEAEFGVTVHIRRRGLMDAFCDVVFLPHRAQVALPRYPGMSATDIDRDRFARNPFAAAAGKRLAKELGAFLKERLPEYMIPAFFVEMQALPLTGNGKVDYRGLPAPAYETTQAGRQITPAENPTEVILLKIWSQVFGTDRIGVEDNVFDIGGDSLLIFRLAALANREGVRITPRNIFQHRTIRDLARFSSAQQTDALPAAGPALIRIARPRSTRTPSFVN